MSDVTYAFETQTGTAARSARRCTGKYIEDAPELISRFGAKSLYGKGQLCWTFQKGGA